MSSSSNAGNARLRAQEIMFVDPTRREEWLAGQLDEFEDILGGVRDELVKLRQVLTGLLVSVCLALIVVPVSVLLHN